MFNALLPRSQFILDIFSVFLALNLFLCVCGPHMRGVLL